MFAPLQTARWLVVVACGFACAAPLSGSGEEVSYLEQGLSSRDRQRLYYVPQGSELMPYAWFLALEQPIGKALFRDNDHLEGFRFAANPGNEFNPDGLPVGFARGKGADGADWFGLTCAACHTTDLSYRGRRLRVDGGTTLADMIGFQQTLVDAVRLTLANPRKFERFARRVQGRDYSPANALALRTSVEAHARKMMNWATTSRPYHPTGFGTWDAVNILLNSVTAVAIDEPANFRVPHSPVSYPSIWQTNSFDRLLWNGAVHNVAMRQVGEVIIVFGRAEVKPTSKGLEFSSSADFRALDEVYGLVSQIKPPRWPSEIFGQLDDAKVKSGAKIYEREGCAKCHANRPPYPLTAPNQYGKSFIVTPQTPLREIGTDPLYAERFVGRMALPGILAPAFKGTSLEGQTEIPAAILFLTILGQITLAELESLGIPKEDYPRWLGYREMPTLPKTDKELGALVESLLGYRAAPLSGVWASAPYLHNASVPNLYELLLPPEQRSTKFSLGSRDFDPRQVGYETQAFDGGFLYDTSLRGQGNGGHLYGTKITDEERWALVEYLKSM